jgi:hypothetical protein
VTRDEFDLGGPSDDDPTAVLLRGVLHRQADAVRPSGEGLARIQAEIARQEHGAGPRAGGRGHGRRFTPMLAAAAALVVVAAGGTAAVRALHRPTTTAEVGSITVLQSSAADVKATPASALPVYVTARQRGRVVLFREFRTVRGLGDAGAQVAEAVRLAVTQRPQDGDYVQLFAPAPAPTVRATVTPQTVTVDISPAPRPRSEAVTPQEAKAAVDQIVWTATAAAATATSPSPGATATTAPPGGRAVHITLDGRAGQSLFGMVPLSPDLKRQVGAVDPRAGAWIIDVADRSRRRPGMLDASGDAVAVLDARVLVVLTRNGALVRSEEVPLTASEASGGTRPPRQGERGSWSIRGWDVTSPGTYTLEVFAPADLVTEATPPESTAAPSTWPPVAQGQAPQPSLNDYWTDSKTFTVR